jgi:DNA-binding transcriptional regulator YiaG
MTTSDYRTRRGFSVNFVKKVMTQNPESSLGVKLGHLCIKHDMSIAEVSKRLNVSRQAVYLWFCGTNKPKALAIPGVLTLIKELELYSPKGTSV